MSSSSRYTHSAATGKVTLPCLRYITDTQAAVNAWRGYWAKIFKKCQMNFWQYNKKCSKFKQYFLHPCIWMRPECSAGSLHFTPRDHSESVACLKPSEPSQLFQEKDSWTKHYTRQQFSQTSFWTEIQRLKDQIWKYLRVWRHSMSAFTKLPIQTQEESEASLMRDTLSNIFTPIKATKIYWWKKKRNKCPRFG